MKRKTEQKIKSDEVEISSHFSLYTKKFLADSWKPRDKQDVVDLLMECQIGYISCRKAAQILIDSGVISFERT